MDFQKHLDPDEILHTIAEHYALQLPDEVNGVITVEWDEEDGGVNVYLQPDSDSPPPLKSKIDKDLN